MKGIMKTLAVLCFLALPACDGDKPKDKEASAKTAKKKAEAESDEPDAAKPKPNLKEKPTTPAEGGGGEDVVKLDLAGLAPDAAATKLHELAQGKNATEGLKTLPFGAKVTIVVDTAACHEEQRKKKREDKDPCVEGHELDAAGVAAWVDENVVDPPGWDAGVFEACHESCCSFADLAEAATKDGTSVPHEFYELAEVCFTLDAEKTKTIDELRFVLH